MKSYQVIRTHVSPYQKSDFLAQEKASISSLGALNYRLLADFKDEDTILITNTHTKLRDLPPQILKRTKLIVHPNSGYDHFSSDYELIKNVPLIIGHTIRAQAVAEYSIGALFEGMMEMPQHLTWHTDRTWERTLLKGTSVWIFGHGHIGKIIHKTLSAIGMAVTVVDPFQPNCLQNWRDGNITDARVIIAATGLNQTSYHLFNEDFFQKLGEKVLFINGARGKLVDEKALKSYLLSHPESFAFLDVFESEPFSEEWHGFPQVWKTSHIAGVESDLDQKILDFELEVIREFISIPLNEFLERYKKELMQNKWINGVLI